MAALQDKIQAEITRLRDESAALEKKAQDWETKLASVPEQLLLLADEEAHKVWEWLKSVL